MKNITIALVLMASPVMAQESIRVYNPPAGAVAVLKAGDTMTGPLTLAGSSLTVTGNAFSVGTSAFVVTGGKVGVGTANPSTIMGIAGAVPQPIVYDNTVVGINKGGFWEFGGSYTGTSPTGWAGIGGYKETATDGEYGGYLSLKTRPNGGANTERIRVTSAGSVGIGTTSPASKVDISSGTIRMAGTGAPTVGFALCLTANGAMGHCTAVTAADGSCTCVTP